jgi:hypothetical protein
MVYVAGREQASARATGSPPEMKRAAPIPFNVDLTMRAMQERFGPSWKFSEIAGWTLARARTEPMSPWQAQWARDFIETRRAAQGDWEDLAS